MLWLILAYLFGVASGAVGMMFAIAWSVAVEFQLRTWRGLQRLTRLP